MDIAVSYARLLLGDNDPDSPTYTDEQIQSAITLGPPPSLPADVVLVGVLTFKRFPFEPPSAGHVNESMDDVLNVDNIVDMDTLEETV